MEYRRLGTTDITVSVIAMGCWAIAGGKVWGPQDDEDSVATVRAALDCGVNFFDTAEAYGHGTSETVLGKALVGRREEAIIATKVSPRNLASEDLQAACENSLRRLGTDYVDLYQIHWPNHDVPVEETMAALEKLHAQGKVRAIGVCNFGVRDLFDLLAVGRCETNQIPYSLLWRAVEDEIIPKCRENDLDILPYSPLAQGLLTGKYASIDDVPPGRAGSRHFSGGRPATRHGEPGCERETSAAIDAIRCISDRLQEPMVNVSLAWLLHQPGVASVLAGARSPGQITQTSQAAGLMLSSEVLVELAKAGERLKQCLGPNPDMWSSESRFR